MTGLYDVIIAGAGPGGATAAYFLGEAGQRVLVLEKETLPRYKACGGGLSADMLAEIFPFPFEEVIETQVKAIAYTFGQSTIAIPLPDHLVCTVMRDRFDAHILAHARAEVRQGMAVRKVTETADRVIVETAEGDTFQGRYLIGADGANSIVAQALGLRRGKTLAAAIEAEVPASPESLRRFGEALRFIFGDVRHGYAWIFPKAHGLSMGVAALHPKPGQLQAALAQVGTRYGLSLAGVKLRGHPIPVYTRREPIATVRMLLVGDAAGLADPFSGEGIRLAIKSGRLAAEVILSGQLNRYPTLIWHEIGFSHTFGLGLALLFYNFPHACFLLGAHNPYATHAFMDMLADRAGYPEVILRIFGTLPVFLLTEGLAALAGLLGGLEWQNQVRTATYGRG